MLRAFHLLRSKLANGHNFLDCSYPLVFARRLWFPVPCDLVTSLIAYVTILSGAILFWCESVSWHIYGCLCESCPEVDWYRLILLYQSSALRMSGLYGVSVHSSLGNHWWPLVIVLDYSWLDFTENICLEICPTILSGLMSFFPVFS